MNKNQNSNVADRNEVTIFMPESKAKNPFEQKGTMQGWYDTIGRLSKGNSRLIFAISVPFTGPLLKPLGLESGGFNLRASTSSGKSSALFGAGSVYGKGSNIDGFVRNWRATSNGLEALAALHTDTALLLDELGQAPANTISEASYMLGNGSGKQRSNKDGSYKEAKIWNLPFLSTGEVSMAQKIRESGAELHAGQEVRLIDIPADAGKGYGILEDLHEFDTADAFLTAYKMKFAVANYGHAGRLFVKRLQADFQASIKFVEDFINDNLKLFCPASASPQAIRSARRFLLVAAAGELAIKFKIVPWDEGEAFDAARKCFDAWAEARGGLENSEDMMICNTIMTYVHKYWTGRFWDLSEIKNLKQNQETPPQVWIAEQMPDKGIQAGFKDVREDCMVFYIFAEIFENEIFPGHEHKSVAKVLLAHGILLKGDGGYKKKLPIDIAGFGRKRCYAIKVVREKLDENEQDLPEDTNANGQSQG